MSDFDEFKQYYSLSSKLIDELTKEQLCQVARMLALHLADYQARFGDMPRSDLLRLLGAAEINEEQAKLLRDGMLTLVGYLGLMFDDDEDEDNTVH
jgi:hypothetical protein